MRLLKVNVRLPNPKVPTSRTDPVQAGRQLSRIFKSLDIRYKNLKTEINALFSAIPVAQANADDAGIDDGSAPGGSNNYNYFYDYSAARAATFNEQLQAILAKWLLEGYAQNKLWMGMEVESAFQQGTATAQVNLANLSQTYATERSLTNIIYSAPYQTRIGLAYANTYNDWNGLSQAAKANLSDVISTGIAVGSNPKSIVTEISDRLDVSRSYAQNIAQTEITGTLRNARMYESDEAFSTLGLKTTLLWTSALLPTTRPWHARRHGHTYTTAQVREFYASRGNRYRCHCAITEALILDDKPVISDKLTTEYGKELSTWESKKAA